MSSFMPSLSFFNTLHAWPMASLQSFHNISNSLCDGVCWGIHNSTKNGFRSCNYLWGNALYYQHLLQCNEPLWNIQKSFPLIDRQPALEFWKRVKTLNISPQHLQVLTIMLRRYVAKGLPPSQLLKWPEMDFYLMKLLAVGHLMC